MIQPLFGACSSGWFKKKTNRPPGASTRAISAIAGSCVGDVLEHEADDDRVERAVGERQRIGVAAGVVHRRPRCRATVSCAIVGIDADDERRAVARRPARDLAFTGADVEDARRAREALPRERQDLLLVLGVGAVGEAVLPPAGVAFPEVVEVFGIAAAPSSVNRGAVSA